MNHFECADIYDDLDDDVLLDDEIFDVDNDFVEVLHELDVYGGFVELLLDQLEEIIVHDHDVQQEIFVDQVDFNDLQKQLLLPELLVLDQDGEQIFQHFSYIG